MSHPTPEQRRALRDKRLRESGLPYIECLECGAALRIAGTHLARVHGMTLREYLLKHRVPLGFRFITDDLMDDLRGHNLEPERLERFLAFIHSDQHIQRLKSKNFREEIGGLLSETKQLRMSDEQRSELRERMRLAASISASRRSSINLAHGRSVARTCQYCGNEYVSKWSARLKYCSQSCHHKSMKGVPRRARIIEGCL